MLHGAVREELDTFLCELGEKGQLDPERCRAAELTPLGERLLGLTPWPARARRRCVSE